MPAIRTCLVRLSVGVVILFCPATASAQARDVDCDKCVNASDIAEYAVDTSHLKDGSVTADKIAVGALLWTAPPKPVIGVVKHRSATLTVRSLNLGAWAHFNQAWHLYTSPARLAPIELYGRCRCQFRDRKQLGR